MTSHVLDSVVQNHRSTRFFQKMNILKQNWFFGSGGIFS